MTSRDGARVQHSSPEPSFLDRDTKSLNSLDRTVTVPTRPEHDSNDSSPQITFGTAPEIHHQTSPPEVITGMDSIRRERTEKDPSINSRICGFSKNLVWVSISLVVLAIAAIAIGLGIRVRVSKGSPKASTPSLEDRILNGTSLASISLSTKERHLFFQDHTGAIRQAVYTASKDQWATTSLFVTADAKNYTPLAVASANSPDSSETMYLFYITADLNVACVAFMKGVWTSRGENSTGLSGARSAPNATSLSASRMLGHLPRSEISNGLSNGPSDELCLLYENADGNVTMLIGKVVHVDPSLKTKWTWKWDDISEKLYSSLPETHFGPPFQGNNGWSPKMGNSSIIEVIGRDTTIATNQGEDPVRGRFLTSVYTSNNKTFSSHNYPNSYDQRIEQSDVALVDGPLGFGLWVEDQKLAFLYTGRMANIRLLESPFPFPRLARSFPQDRTVFYLYHQLNGSAFAEDQWDASISEWTKSTNIHISEH